MSQQRPGPLRRRTRLTRNTENPAKASRLARTEAIARGQPTRTAPLQRRPRRARTREEAAAHQRFVAAAGAQGRCANCPSEGPWHPHHAGVYEQKLRALGLPLWHPDNALRLCRECHFAHHRSRAGRIPLRALRDENIAYAFSVLGTAAHAYLMVRYAGTDTRVDRALARLEQPDRDGGEA